MRVDFHTHFIASGFPDMGEKYGGEGWPKLVHDGACDADIYYAEKHYRRIDERSWDVERRIKDMDAEGIDVQVISPIPVTFGYRFSALAVQEIAQMQNEEIARAVSVAPQRFVGLGTVPLQDAELAALEVRRVVRDLGLAGVEIGTNVQGKNLDDEELEPFWRASVEVGAAVFVHPASVLAPERTKRHRMEYSVGYTTETGIAAASVIMSGLLDRYPELRLCFAHGGGTLPWLLPRLDQTWRTFEEVRATLASRPSDVAKLLTYDTLTYDTLNLLLLIERLGVERLVMGSDYPFPLRETPAGKVIDDLEGVSMEQRERMLGRNALRFLDREEMFVGR